jgi:hypothetical protein
MLIIGRVLLGWGVGFANQGQSLAHWAESSKCGENIYAINHVNNSGNTCSHEKKGQTLDSEGAN